MVGYVRKHVMDLLDQWNRLVNEFLEQLGATPDNRHEFSFVNRDDDVLSAVVVRQGEQLGTFQTHIDYGNGLLRIDFEVLDGAAVRQDGYHVGVDLGSPGESKETRS